MTAPPDDHNVTKLLGEWRRGDAAALERLLPIVYKELRRVASARMRSEQSDLTLQATALVHEAYLRLVGQREVDWRDRAHFFGLASVTMRRVLVDHARRRRAKRRDPGEGPAPLTVAVGDEGAVDLLDLDRALDRFAERFPRQAKVVEMRYFTGLEFDDVARALDLSPRTVKRDWSFARAWLRDALAAAP
jgi:RNA polymerase sigma factor (TIGR02999 family)